MGIVYEGDNPMILAQIIRSETDTGFLATGYKPQITGLLQTGEVGPEYILRNHVGRGYFRKLDEEGLDSFISDDYDSGFRPETFTGLYS